ncbi:MAG TPA: hypothetical protein VMS89_08770 [Methanoregulaceae archaeon]|nr:hypothetical protein [Methanoregulaceae archaeon]
MKQNVIISIVIVVAVCLVVIFFAVGYSRMLQPVSKPAPVTPVPTEAVATPAPTTAVVQTPVPTPTPMDWVSSIQNGTDNINKAKISIVKGKANMDPVLSVQGQYANVITTLYMAQNNFTAAKQYFVSAQSDIAGAARTAPPSQQDSLSKLAAVLGSDAASTDLYIQSTKLGLANQWWDSNNAYNQANSQYTGNIQSTNNLLDSMNILQP